MAHDAVEPAATGFPLPVMGSHAEAHAHAPEFFRLWRGFMTARSLVGLALLLFEGTLYHLGQSVNGLLIAVCAAYFAAALAVQLMLPPRPLGAGFGPVWLLTAGVDIAAFTALQFLQGHAINFTPLYALPVLLAAVLGPLLTAMGTAASVTLLLLADAAWLASKLQVDAAPPYIQAALASVGSFAIAGLAHQLAARLASEEQQAQRHQLAARLQQQVNALVIESTSDGILVVDAAGTVHAANPAARQMLQAEEWAPQEPPFDLQARSAWRPLAALVEQSLQQGDARQADLVIAFPGQGPRRLRARTRLTNVPDDRAAALCVVFLQDLRALEARLRADKLASMGRMSVAVAHEIRNPLAAISQANALLDEELTEPRQRQLTGLVRQNARRLEKIVEEILDVSRVHNGPAAAQAPALDLHAAVAQICADWAAQTSSERRLQVSVDSGQPLVAFEHEHLRRVLVNLLDNAGRYASPADGAIQVWTRLPPQGGTAELGVWSDSPPIEPSMERHLFEPFFSSESRSSGLGLYLCRELCDSHGAAIGHRRAQRPLHGTPVDGNEFFVSLRLRACSR